MTTTPVNMDSDNEPDAANLSNAVPHPKTRESWTAKARIIWRPLALISVGSLSVALYFFIMAVISLIDGTYLLLAFYSISAVVLTALGPFLVYKCP